MKGGAAKIVKVYATCPADERESAFGLAMSCMGLGKAVEDFVVAVRGTGHRGCMAGSRGCLNSRSPVGASIKTIYQILLVYAAQFRYGKGSRSACPSFCCASVSYTHLTLPTKRIV